MTSSKSQGEMLRMHLYNIFKILDISPQENKVIKILGWNVFFCVRYHEAIILSKPGVYILGPKSTNSPPPPPFPVLQTSLNHTFLQKFGAVFRALRGKFKELGCKIYTPYGFLMLIQLFLNILQIFYVHFPQFFVIACYFPPFCKSWEVTNFPLAYKIPPPRGGGA